MDGGGGVAGNSCPTHETPWTVIRHTPLSMGFARQEYWSGSPFPSPGDLPHPGIKLAFPALAGRFFTTDHEGSLVEVQRGELTEKRFAFKVRSFQFVPQGFG